MSQVHLAAFHPDVLSLNPSAIVIRKELTDTLRASRKYRQIAVSIEAVGLVEPLVVFPQLKGKYGLVDGHVRFEVLRKAGVTQIPCLVAKEDEGYTYNNRVNRLPAVAEHFMILKAVKHGVTEKSIADALGYNVEVIRQRRDLLNGICAEAAELLRDKHVAILAFTALRKMKALRQVEAAEFMIASNNYTYACANALLTGTKPSLLVEPEKRKPSSDISQLKQSKLEDETDNLLKQVKALEKSFGTDVLHLTLIAGYFRKLLTNTAVRRYLAKRHPEMFEEIQNLLALLEKARHRTRAGPLTKSITAMRKKQASAKSSVSPAGDAKSRPPATSRKRRISLPK